MRTNGYNALRSDNIVYRPNHVLIAHRLDEGQDESLDSEHLCGACLLLESDISVACVVGAIGATDDDSAVFCQPPPAPEFGVVGVGYYCTEHPQYRLTFTPQAGVKRLCRRSS